MTKAEIIEYLYDNNVRGDLSIEEMAEDLAKDEPQTDIHGLTDCDFCKGKNCEDCEGGKDEPQTERNE